MAHLLRACRSSLPRLSRFSGFSGSHRFPANGEGGRLAALDKVRSMSSTGNEKLTPPVVHDGMPRYPNISPPGALRAMDLFGTGVFALSGTLTAGIAGMDLLGCTIVGTITAVGGGTIRDILLGKGPAFWMDEIEYLYICLATALATFYFWDDITAATGITEDGLGLFIADTIGVGAFAVIGAQNGERSLMLTDGWQTGSR
eukprot:jgi/Mesvir1/25994/Mv20962-RA.2